LIFCSRLRHSVSSACVPAARPARVFQCRGCGLAQKSDADLVIDYSSGYVLFDNDPTADKIVHRPGQPPRSRSQVIAQLLLTRLGARRHARVLEVGCHRGTFLASVKALAPEWDLHGFDLSPSFEPWVSRICGQGHYHHGDLSRVEGPFDACVLIHTLEHVPRPLDTLTTLRQLLPRDGLLLVVVPDCRHNSSDFYTIDHTSHYEASVLTSTVARAGFTAQALREEVPNELTAVCRLSEPGAGDPNEPVVGWDGAAAELECFERGLSALPAVPYHVFGTAPTGFLVAEALKQHCVGLVDEAPFRVGKTLQGWRVRHPEEVAGQRVVLGVAKRLAEQLQPRLRGLGCVAINPWESAA
jgi:hypothetical protein